MSQLPILSCDGCGACVIVESSFSAICDELDDPNKDRKVSSETIIGVVSAWPRRYGVHWLFAGDRRRAEVLAFRVMWKWWQENGSNVTKTQ